MIFDTIWSHLSGSPFFTAYAFFSVIALCLIFQLAFLRKAIQRDGNRVSVWHFIWVYVFLFYLMLVYQVTGIGNAWIIGRYPTLIRPEEIHLVPFGAFSGVQASLLNILLTVPFGFLLPLIWKSFRRFWVVTGLGFLLSLLIELSQLLNRRASTVDDLIMNTLGAALGYLIFKLIYLAFMRERESDQPTPMPFSRAVRFEPIIYLLCSFAGMFLFYNGQASTPSWSAPDPSEVVVVGTNYLTGAVQDVTADTITVERVITQDVDGIAARFLAGSAILLVAGRGKAQRLQ